MNEEIEKFKKNSVVVSPIGGKGTRMLPVEVADSIRKRFGEEELEKLYTPKPLVTVGEKTLIERFIEEYKRNGIDQFVFLVGREEKEIEEFLGDGSKYGVEIVYSYDPPVEKVGKGKALRYAFERGVIELEKNIFWGFPDDIILYPYYIEESTMRFLYYRKKYKVIGLLIFAPKARFPYGTAKIDGKGLVREFREKPEVDLPTNTGRGIFVARELYPYVQDLIDINSPEVVELEDSVLPKLAEDGKLASWILPESENFISINSFKEWKLANKRLCE